MVDEETRKFKPRQNLMYALTWQLIAELMRRDEELRPLVFYPGSSPHGVMRLVRQHPLDEPPDTAHLDFHLGGGGFGALTPSGSWNESFKLPGWRDGSYTLALVEAEDPAIVVSAVAEAARIENPTKLPPTSPAALCARVIARVLSSYVTSNNPLRTSPGYEDRDGGIVACPWLEVISRLTPVPVRQDQLWRALWGWWILHTGLVPASPGVPLEGTAIAFDFDSADAWVLTAKRASGPTNLMGLYQDGGRKIRPLAHWVEEHLHID